MPGLIIYTNDDTRAVPLQERATIGRAPESDFVLPDPILSRCHAEIERRADGYYIVDRGSRNGTFVNDAPVLGARRLQDGDVLRAGESLLTFVDALPDSESPGFLSQPTFEGQRGLTLAREVTNPGLGLLEGAAGAGLERLGRAARALASCESLAEVLERGSHLFADLARAEAAGIALLEGRPPTVIARASVNRGEGSSQVVPPVELIHQVIAADGAVVARLVETDSGPASAVCIPLRSGGDRMLGFAYAARSLGTLGPYGYADESILGLWAHLLAAQIEAARAREVDVAHRRLRSDLGLAALVQQRLMPASAPQIPGYDVAGQCLPSLSVGGDYFDLSTDPDAVRLAVGDVSGKGAGAAMLMMALRAAVRTHWQEDSLGSAAAAINQSFLENLPDDRYATAVLARLAPHTGRLTYVNAGHIPPWLVRASGRIERLTSGGTGLGMLENSLYDSSIVRLHPGDTLVCCTDGVVESFGPEGDRVLEETLLRSAPHLSAEALLARVLEASAPRGGVEGDDRTVLVLKRC